MSTAIFGAVTLSALSDPQPDTWIIWDMTLDGNPITPPLSSVFSAEIEGETRSFRVINRRPTETGFEVQVERAS